MTGLGDGMTTVQLAFVIGLDLVAFAGWATALWLWTGQGQGPRYEPGREVVAFAPALKRHAPAYRNRPMRAPGQRERIVRAETDWKIRRHV